MFWWWLFSWSWSIKWLVSRQPLHQRERVLSVAHFSTARVERLAVVLHVLLCGLRIKAYGSAWTLFSLSRDKTQEFRFHTETWRGVSVFLTLFIRWCWLVVVQKEVLGWNSKTGIKWSLYKWWPFLDWVGQETSSFRDCIADKVHTMLILYQFDLKYCSVVYCTCFNYYTMPIILTIAFIL